MLIQFKAANFRSIKDEICFSMQPYKGNNEYEDNLMRLKEKGVKGDKDLPLLKSALIFGPNAAGKSNVLKALASLKQIVAGNHRLQLNGEIRQISPFGLDKGYMQQPSFFELFFIIDNVRYVYGLKVSKKNVVQEYLVYWPKGRAQEIFSRSGQDIVLSKYEADYDLGKNIINEIRENQLALSILTYRNYTPVKKVFDFITSKINIIGISPFYNYEPLNKYLIKNEVIKSGVQNIMRKIDVGISFISLKEVQTPYVTEDDDGESVEEIHTSYMVTFAHESDNGNLLLPLGEESDGTRRCYYLAGYILSIINQGGVLLVDEIDSSMHHVLVKELLNAVHSMDGDCRFQLIATSHDLELFDRDCKLRRDQYWLANKDYKSGATDIYSIADFKVRKDLDLKRAYLNGRFDAVPFIDLRRTLSCNVSADNGE